MEMKRLTGGKMIGVNPQDTSLPLYGEEAKWRIEAPGTVQGNAASHVHLVELSKRLLGFPEPTLVKVMVRDLGTAVYLLMAPVKEEGPDVYELKNAVTRGKQPVVRKLKRLFKEAKLSLRGDAYYEVKVEVAEDEVLGPCLAGNWTDAVLRIPQSKSDDVAAGTDGDHVSQKG